jgi:predicted pyridoxine 5'-phosphate oxidase superfamily flavin-nucleotide-binding protein
MHESPFNADELAAQALAGGGPRGHGLQHFMSEQSRNFFAQLPYIFIAAIDADGWPLATLLTGRPGFVQATDPTALRIDSVPDAADPAASSLVADREIGVLGIDFSTRRRNRVNGRIARRDAAGVTLAVSQSFGNCPQYIQRRSLEQSVIGRYGGAAMPAESFEHLDEAAQSAIVSADTFFVASRARCGDAAALGAGRGADISHRGGRPGFIRIGGDVLTIPDFRGNRYFNTLGNLIAEPRASLLFVDFETGDLLQLQGRTEVDWSGAAAEQIEGAERLWRFHVTRGWRRKAGSPLRWSFIDYSRTTTATGLWHGPACGIGRAFQTYR